MDRGRSPPVESLDHDCWLFDLHMVPTLTADRSSTWDQGRQRLVHYVTDGIERGDQEIRWQDARWGSIARKTFDEFKRLIARETQPQ